MEPLKALLQKGECDRSLALYMAADVVELLGERGIRVVLGHDLRLSVPYWNFFMEIACLKLRAVPFKLLPSEAIVSPTRVLCCGSQGPIYVLCGRVRLCLELSSKPLEL